MSLDLYEDAYEYAKSALKIDPTDWGCLKTLGDAASFLWKYKLTKSIFMYLGDKYNLDNLRLLKLQRAG